MIQFDKNTIGRQAKELGFVRDTFKDSIRLTDNELHEDLYSERSSIIRKLKAYRKQQQEQIYPKPKQKELDDELEMQCIYNIIRTNC